MTGLNYRTPPKSPITRLAPKTKSPEQYPYRITSTLSHIVFDIKNPTSLCKSSLISSQCTTPRTCSPFAMALTSTQSNIPYHFDPICMHVLFCVSCALFDCCLFDRDQKASECSFHQVPVSISKGLSLKDSQVE